MLGSVGVIIAALATKISGWGWVDPAIGAAIGLFILPRAWRLGGDALRVLVQAAPQGLDVDAVNAALVGIPGVDDVHDLHVWTLTSEMDVLTAHLSVNGDVDRQEVLDAARTVLNDRFGLAHATLQVERASSECDDLSW